MPWSLVANLITKRYWLAGCGEQKQSLQIGGLTGSGGYSSCTNLVEKYNGISWENTNSLNTKRGETAAFGTDSQAIVFCGGSIQGSTIILKTTEFFNGTNWQNSQSVNIPIYEPAGCGTQNQGLKIGGATMTNDRARTNIVQLYNGTIWINKHSLNYNRGELQASGTSNQALQFNGCINTGKQLTNIVEFYNDTVWQILEPNQTVRSYIAGMGIQNNTLSCGGSQSTTTYSQITNTVEKYNGTTWYIYDSLNIGRMGLGGGGSQDQAIAFCGWANSTTLTAESLNTTVDINYTLGIQSTYGTHPGVTISTNKLSFVNQDISPMTSSQDSPLSIVQGIEYSISYERYFRIVQNEISQNVELTNFKVYTLNNTTNGSYIYYKKNTVYQTPKKYNTTTQITNSNYTLMPTDDNITSNLSGTLKNVGDSTDYGIVVLQLTHEYTSKEIPYFIVCFDEKVQGCVNPTISNLSPTHNTLNTDIEVNISWSISGITNSYFQYKKETDTDFLTYEMGSVTYYTLTDLEYNTKYNWRIKQENNTEDCEISTVYSSTYSFTTSQQPIEDCIYPQVTLLTPQNNQEKINLNNCQLTWSGNFVTKYFLTYWKESGTKTTISNVTSPYTIPSILQANTKYRWQITQINDSETNSCNSVSQVFPIQTVSNPNSYFEFTTKQYCSSPIITILSPTNNSNISPIGVITWSQQNSTNFSVYLSLDSINYNLIGETTENSLTYGALQVDSECWIKIIQTNNQQDCIPPTPVESEIIHANVKEICLSPSFTSMNPEINETSQYNLYVDNPVISWTASNAIKYRVYYKKVQDQDYSYIDTTETSINLNTIGLLKSTYYSIYITAYNEGEDCVQSKTNSLIYGNVYIVLCTEPISIEILTPSNGDTVNTTPTVTWEQEGATRYKLYYYEGIEVPEAPQFTNYIYTTSYTFSNQLSPNTTYSFYILAENHLDQEDHNCPVPTSIVSETQTFTTNDVILMPCIAPIINLISPVNGYSSNTKSVTLRWSGQNANKYQVMWKFQELDDSTYVPLSFLYVAGNISTSQEFAQTFIGFQNKSYVWYVIGYHEPQTGESCNTSINNMYTFRQTFTISPTAL